MQIAPRGLDAIKKEAAIEMVDLMLERQRFETLALQQPVPALGRGSFDHDAAIANDVPGEVGDAEAAFPDSIRFVPVQQTGVQESDKTMADAMFGPTVTGNVHDDGPDRVADLWRSDRDARRRGKRIRQVCQNAMSVRIPGHEHNVVGGAQARFGIEDNRSDGHRSPTSSKRQCLDAPERDGAVDLRRQTLKASVQIMRVYRRRRHQVDRHDVHRHLSLDHACGQVDDV